MQEKMVGDEDKRQDTLANLQLMIEDETDPTYENKLRVCVCVCAGW